LLASADADTHVPHDWIEILKEPPGRIESIGGIDIVAAANDE
jgi:hypothetical protein